MPTLTIQQVQAGLDAERRREASDPSNPIELSDEVKRADAITCVIISALSNPAKYNKHLDRLNKAITPPNGLSLQNPSFDTYQIVHSIAMPSPPETEITEAAVLVENLEKELLKQQQSFGVNLGRNVKQIPKFFGSVDSILADQLLMNNDLWFEENGDYPTLIHGPYSHAIQFWVVMEMILNGDVDTSGLAPYFDLEKPYFLFKHLVRGATKYFFSNKQAHWNMALENDRFYPKGKGTFSILYDDDRIKLHLAGPTQVVEHLLSVESFNTRPALAHAMHYATCHPLFYYSNKMSASVHKVFKMMVKIINTLKEVPPALKNAMNDYVSNTISSLVTEDTSYERFLMFMEFSTRGSLILFGEKPITSPKELSKSCYNNGLDAFKAKEYKMAARFFIQAAEFAAKANSKTNEATNYHSLGSCHRELGNLALSKTYYQKALDIRTTVLGKDHASTQNTAKALAKIVELQKIAAPPIENLKATPVPQ